MARTQQTRKQETRARLLAAAADLFARKGFEGVSIDEIADAADRTSGSVYAHFGSKAALLQAVAEHHKNQVAAATEAELVARQSDFGLETLWRNFVDPAGDDGDAWVLLEHELWLFAARQGTASDAQTALADRYAEARHYMAEAVRAWLGPDADPPAPAHQIPTLLLGLMLGLEMQRRIDPGAVPDDLALAALRRLLGDHA